jgi:hypothetical protein
MADIFISYASADRGRATELAEALAKCVSRVLLRDTDSRSTAYECTARSGTSLADSLELR